MVNKKFCMELYNNLYGMIRRKCDVDKYIKLTFLGDIMCEKQMLKAFSKGKGKYCFKSLFEPCKKLFSTSDYVYANLETPIAYDNNELTNEKYSFCSPYEFAEAVKNAGIDFVATANNHCLDRGIIGISSTVRSLNYLGLAHTGVFEKKEKTLLLHDVEGIKIGVLAYTYGTNAFSNHNYLSFNDYWRVNLFQNQELSSPIMRILEKKKGSIAYRIIRKLLSIFPSVNKNRMVYERREWSLNCRRKLKGELMSMRKQSPDLIIMYMHAGGQYNPEATTETKKLVGFLINNGVNIVVGSHEHVVHGGMFKHVDDNKVATYSLGNFDGIIGVYEAPFDKMAEYSIAWHVYVNKTTKKIAKTSFSVLKTVQEDKTSYKIKTVPAHDLYYTFDEDAKKKLLDDIIEIAFRFSGKDISSLGVQQEYVI